METLIYFSLGLSFVALMGVILLGLFQPSRQDLKHDIALEIERQMRIGKATGAIR